MRLLEKNHVEQTFFDGAQFNLYASKRSDGRLYGLKIAHDTGRIFVQEAGMLLVRGYRVTFDAAEVLQEFSAYPEQMEEHNLILRIRVSSGESSSELTGGPVEYKAEIEKGAGAYDYLLCTYRIGPDGLIDINPKIRDARMTDSIFDAIDAQNLSEDGVTQRALALTDGIYIANTQLCGDEILMIQKSGQSIARYNALGESYYLDRGTAPDYEMTWRRASGGGAGGGGAKWIVGSLVDGPQGAIADSTDEGLLELAQIGDMYLNTDAGSASYGFVYICIGKMSTYTNWQYALSTRGPTGPSGPIGPKGDNNVTQVTVTILATDWSDNAAVKTVEGITATNTVWVSPASGSYSDFTAALIRAAAQSTNQLTFVCNTAPATDIDVIVAFAGDGSEPEKVVQPWETVVKYHATAGINALYLQTGTVNHSYLTAKVYSIKITGGNPFVIEWGDGLQESVSAAFAGFKVNNGSDRLKYLEVYIGTNCPVGDFAFYNCNALRRVEFAPGWAYTSIGANAFLNGEFREIVLPDTITEIGVDAFQSCNSLVSVNIPKLVTSLSNTFNNCTALENIFIPKAITLLNKAFYACLRLRTIEFEHTADDTLPTIATGAYAAFAACRITDIIATTAQHADDIATALVAAGATLLNGYRKLY